jgi:N-acetylmuramoyl-L-alanine amidase
VPEINGPLAIKVVYPPASSTVPAVDSSFLFGSVGSGRAELTINGQPVKVWPNGAWLAWLRFPTDTIIRFEIQARLGGQTVAETHQVRRAREFRPRRTVWIDTTSFAPRGQVWWPGSEVLPVSVRAAEDATVRLLLPDGRSVPLTAVASPGRVSDAIRAFDRDSGNLTVAPAMDRYYGALHGVAIGDLPASPIGAAGKRPSGADPVVEAVLGGDTARARWPLRIALLGPIPVLAELDDDSSRSGTTDRITVGRSRPGATYHWFFPTGTRVGVTGRVNGDLRVRLSAASTAWVSAAEAVPLATQAVLPPAVVGSLTATPREGHVEVRIPVSWRTPYQVEESERGLALRFYGAVGDPNWIRYGESVGALRSVTWRQVATDEVDLSFQLDRPLWGYRIRWDRTDLLLELRPRPRMDPVAPLRGRLIVVDPGHPPLGSTGPTGLRERDATLAVARLLREMLSEAGAAVVLTRTSDSPVDLWPRVHLADSLEADLLVSIHGNALPDGVNPFRNNGTSTFYFHPRSLPLALAIQRALVHRLASRDLGVARADLALTRGTWMPSVLVEGMFVMMPEEEAALRSPDGQRAYAEGVYRGIVQFMAGKEEGPAL